MMCNRQSMYVVLIGGDCCWVDRDTGLVQDEYDEANPSVPAAFWSYEDAERAMRRFEEKYYYNVGGYTIEQYPILGKRVSRVG